MRISIFTSTWLSNTPYKSYTDVVKTDLIEEALDQDDKVLAKKCLECRQADNTHYVIVQW